MTAVQSCPNCGAALTFQDMSGQSCPYCKGVLRHQARAVEHAALVNQVLQQNLPHNPWVQNQPRVPSAFGAPMPDHATETAQNVQKAVNRSLVLTAVLVIVPLVLVFVGAGVALALFLL